MLEEQGFNGKEVSWQNQKGCRSSSAPITFRVPYGTVVDPSGS